MEHYRGEHLRRRLRCLINIERYLDAFHFVHDPAEVSWLALTNIGVFEPFFLEDLTAYISVENNGSVEYGHNIKLVGDHRQLLWKVLFV